MNKLKLLILIVFISLNTGCYSKGPTVRIETPEPAEDFVLICDWHTDALFNFFSSSVLSKRIIHVVRSGEETPCGVAWMGGRPSSWIMHPVYWGVKKTKEDGITVYRYTGTKLDYLDKQKEKFEAGYWDKHPYTGAEYARSLVGCGFPHQYFDYYSEVKKVDKEHFKRLYHDEILKCKKRVIPIFNKYLSRAYTGKRPSPEESMNNLWNSNGWEKYK